MDRSNAKCVTGTVPHGPPDWDAIEWRKVFRSGRRLQSRIAKAMREGRRGKVHALQRILTRSRGAACLAVRRVTTNNAGMFVTDIAGSREGALKGLSRMRGNFHVRFSGGRVDG